MDKLRLPPDFKEFLQLLNSEKVEYLLVGGLAVGIYGYPRATGDMDLWVAATSANAAKLARVMMAFGFSAATIGAENFDRPNQIIRMGVPPVCIDLITTATGVDFAECYVRRQSMTIDGVDVSVIHADDLKANKKASGRAKDMNDLENLP
ncbi:MAG: nucleotidyltransferase [Pirellulales bacterium]